MPWHSPCAARSPWLEHLCKVAQGPSLLCLCLRPQGEKAYFVFLVTGPHLLFSLTCSKSVLTTGQCSLGSQSLSKSFGVRPEFESCLPYVFSKHSLSAPYMLGTTYHHKQDRQHLLSCVCVLFFSFSFVFLGLHPQHMAVPRLRV